MLSIAKNMKNKYLPEGMISKSENNKYFSSVENLEKAKREGVILEGRALICDAEQNLIVDLGKFRGLIPREEAQYTLGDFKIKDIAILTRVGKPVCFKVIDIKTMENGEITPILSRKEAQRECYEKYITSLKAGDIISGRVTHLENFGAFVDIGCGVISMLSIESMSISRISHPRDRFEVGKYIKVIVRSPLDENGRIILTHKELLGTWEENASCFSVGETVEGIVRSIENYGVFVEIAPNLAGLAEYKNGTEVGNRVAVFIKSIIPEKMKLKLVLVDGGMPDTRLSEMKYFCTEDHIDEWQYSPSNCQKVVKVCFTSDND